MPSDTRKPRHLGERGSTPEKERAPGKVSLMTSIPNRDDLRGIETRDLIAEVEAWRYLALEVADDPDGSRAYVAREVEAMVAELERRQRLRRSRPDDPLTPAWPNERFRDRVAAVKAAWPVERLARELLCLDLIPTGQDRYKARCPLPGHDDRTPSFAIDAAKGVAFCHGCKRGGDVLKIAQMVLNEPRFMVVVEALEREGGIR